MHGKEGKACYGAFWATGTGRDHWHRGPPKPEDLMSMQPSQVLRKVVLFISTSRMLEMTVVLCFPGRPGQHSFTKPHESSEPVARMFSYLIHSEHGINLPKSWSVYIAPTMQHRYWDWTTHQRHYLGPFFPDHFSSQWFNTYLLHSSGREAHG